MQINSSIAQHKTYEFLESMDSLKHMNLREKLINEGREAEEI